MLAAHFASLVFQVLEAMNSELDPGSPTCSPEEAINSLMSYPHQSTMSFTTLFLPDMSLQRQGHILNITSMSSQVGFVVEGLSHASAEAAVRGFSHHLLWSLKAPLGCCPVALEIARLARL